VTFAAKGAGGVAVATIKNNSSTLFLHRFTHTNVVFLNSAGIPVYAYWGSLGVSLAPGANARIELPAFLGEDLKFVPSGFSTIEVSLSVDLCESDGTYAKCTS
jgi:hypothetical protein